MLVTPMLTVTIMITIMRNQPILMTHIHIQTTHTVNQATILTLILMLNQITAMPTITQLRESTMLTHMHTPMQVMPTIMH